MITQNPDPNNSGKTPIICKHRSNIFNAKRNYKSSTLMIMHNFAYFSNFPMKKTQFLRWMFSNCAENTVLAYEYASAPNSNAYFHLWRVCDNNNTAWASCTTLCYSTRNMHSLEKLAYARFSALVHVSRAITVLCTPCHAVLYSYRIPVHFLAINFVRCALSGVQ